MKKWSIDYKMRTLGFILIVFLLNSCTRDYDRVCTNESINPVFINFSPSDVDTLIIRKFSPNSNFLQQLDSAIIIYGYSGYYTTSHDSTFVKLNSEKVVIVYGYDYQIYIPAVQRTVSIAKITSELRIDRCHPVNKVDCVCTNRIFTLTEDNQLITYSATPHFGGYFIYINK